MYTYIRQGLNDRYIELNEELDAETYSIGSSLQDYYKGKWIRLDKKQAEYARSNPDAIVDEILAAAPMPRPERTVEQARYEKIFEIRRFDVSDTVRTFTVDGHMMWISKEDRGYRLQRYTAEKARGVKNTVLWDGGIEIDMSVDEAILLIQHLEVYAAACCDATQRHINEVQATETVGGIDSYDFRTGYPRPLVFETHNKAVNMTRL